MSRAIDEKWMRRCLELAEAAAGLTSPNPMVGAVVVKNDRAIAEGIHWGAGQPHAEAMALAQAGLRARGATLYVNLEPCNHQGHTPPCVPQVASAGLARVVFGSRDPFPGHGGAEQLRTLGQRVVGGVCEEECEELNRFFRCFARQKRPYFVLKAAMSLDGKMATARGKSPWITSEEARADGRQWRARLDGILVGVGTVLRDDPKLTARIKGRPDPIRIVLDSELRTPAAAQVFKGRARTIVATVKGASAAKEKALVRAGAEVWRFSGKQVPLGRLAKRLGQEGLLSVLVEGGQTVHQSFAKSRLADEFLLYLAPRLLESDRTLTRVGDVCEVGPDIRLSFRPRA